jgi:hypothetical protein
VVEEVEAGKRLRVQFLAELVGLRGTTSTNLSGGIENPINATGEESINQRVATLRGV